MFNPYLLTAFILLCVSIPFKGEADGVVIIPPMIALSVNGNSPGGTYYNSDLGPSTFNYDATFNDLFNGLSSKSEYTINGAIYTNCGSQGNCNGNGNVWLQVVPKTLLMLNGSNKVSLTLNGVIGGSNLTSTGEARKISFNRTSLISPLPWQANIQLTGNIDQSTVSTSTKPGTYTGTFTIQVTIP